MTVNEPVAFVTGVRQFDPVMADTVLKVGTPLYTHPAKTLTDEEIYACFHQYFVLGEPKPTHYELEYEDLIDFAKAILRKAQEK